MYFLIISKLVQLLTSTYNKSALFLQYHAPNNARSALYILVFSCSSQDN